jgi:hypothetical protein
VCVIATVYGKVRGNPEKVRHVKSSAARVRLVSLSPTPAAQACSTLTLSDYANEHNLISTLHHLLGLHLQTRLCGYVWSVATNIFELSS